MEEVTAEMNWLGVLLANGVSVCRPVMSDSGDLVDQIRIHDVHVPVVAFEKIPGSHPKRADFHPQLFERWGQLLGQMHLASKTHTETQPPFDRRQWHNDENYNAIKRIPASQERVHERVEALTSELREFSADTRSYGLIHGDFHQDNFHLLDGHLTVFDFDDLQYSWYANDIAIALHYARWKCPEGQPMDEFVRCFLTHFLIGYRREISISTSELERIPRFLLLKRILMYANHYRTWDFNRVSSEEQERLGRGRGSIENDRQIVDIDFSSF